MADSPTFLSAHIVETLRKLAGRAKVTYPYSESAHARVERVQKVLRGKAGDGTPTWQLPWETPDQEWPNAYLVTQVKLSEDDTHVEVYRVWEELTGLPLVTRELYAAGVFKETIKQRVPAGTAPDGSGATLADSVADTNARVAERTTVRLVLAADGSALTGGVVLTTAALDDETGVTIFTDRFIAAGDYVLPAVKTAGNMALYIDWKLPNTNGVGYGSVSYDPKRYPIDARKIEIEGSEKVMVEVEYCRKPMSHVRDLEHGHEWPAIFKLSGEFFLPNNYTGRFRPPWPIGADQEDGYSFLAHRTDAFPAREYVTYSIGPREDLPAKFQVQSPGTSSRVMQGLIPQNCIHGALKFNETLPDGTVQLIEDIPSSSPASYDPGAIYVIASEERQWRGEIYRQTVVRASETRKLSEFPDPAVDGYYTAWRNFKGTPLARIVGALNGRQVYAKTVAANGGTGSETVKVRLYGQASANEPLISTGNAVTAKPTPDSLTGAAHSVSASKWLRVEEVLLEAPTASDSVEIWESVVPDRGTLQVTSAPTSGQLLRIGRVGSDVRTYQFRTALAEDSVTGLTLTAPGSGYAVAPLVSITGGGGTGATASATISGGVVTALTMVSPGTGYDTPSVTITPNATTATGTVSVNGSHQVSGVAVTGPGTNYTSAPAVTITPGGTQPAISVTITGGAITAITVTDSGGSGFTSNPTVTITGDGTGATAHVVTRTSETINAIGVDTGGSDYTTATVTLVGGKGSGATATATLSGTTVASVSVTAAGTGYSTISLPHVSFSGGQGSGATATAVVSGANQIKISSSPNFMAGNIAGAVGLGTKTGAGTVAHADVTASRTTSAPTVIAFTSLDPTVNAVDPSTEWVLQTLAADGTTVISTWADVQDFVSGAAGERLCSIPAGVAYATMIGAANFSLNHGTLNDASDDNDRKALASLPAAIVFYTDWLALPAGKAITLHYAVVGGAMRVAYQTADSVTAPTPVAASLVVANNSKTFSPARTSGDIGKAVLIDGDTLENEFLTTTTLLRPYAGTSGTKSASIVPLVATLLPAAGDARLRIVGIGTPNAGYIRLKFTQPMKSISDRLGVVEYRAAYAHAQWQIGPDD